MYCNFEGFPPNSKFFGLVSYIYIYRYSVYWPLFPKARFSPRFWLADKKREFYGVKKEWVDGFELIPIIDVGRPVFFETDLGKNWVGLKTWVPPEIVANEGLG